MIKKLAIVCCFLMVGCHSTGVTRTLPQKVTDVSAERQLLSVLDGVAGLTSNNHRVAINSYRGEMLLTGEVPNQQIKIAVGERAAVLPNVSKVYNYLKISEPKSQSHTVHENYLKAKVLAKLLTSGAINKSQYELVVRDDTLYVMGSMTYPQVQVLQNTVASTDGVLAMVSLLNVMVTASEHQLLQPSAYPPPQHNYPSYQGYPPTTSAPYIFPPNP